MITRRLAIEATLCMMVTAIIMLIGCTVRGVWAQSSVTPTREWISFYGLGSTAGGRPLRLGSIVRAYDRDGVLCGMFVTISKGKYGIMPVYRDDPLTTEIDEGAEPGDAIRFTINGMPATVLGPDEATWTANGDLLRVELAAPAGDHVMLLPLVGSGQAR